MARFPLRLRLALAKARLFHGSAPVRYLRVGEVLHPGDQHPVSHGAVRELVRERHAIVWIGGSEPGSEPLVHPGIGHLGRLIAQSGHFTFLETDAIALRQRIHEFQPLSRFYFVVRFLGDEAEHDRRTQRPNAFRAALEGVRAAQLSGFFVCARMESDSAKLQAELSAIEFDGVMTAASHSSAKNIAWNRFLRMAEFARNARVSASPERPVTLPTAVAEDCEEVTQAQ